MVGEPVHVGARLGRFLVVMDTFLVGVTLMILAFGFYELFVITREREGHRYWLPAWLKMHDIEDLKARVVSMLILVAAITFVDRLVESTVANEVLFLGAGIALVILGPDRVLVVHQEQAGGRQGTAAGPEASSRPGGPEASSRPAGTRARARNGRNRRRGFSLGGKAPGPAAARPCA